MSIPNEKSWKVFESNVVKHSAYLRIPVIKIPERVIYAKGKYIRLKSPIDFTASVDGEAVFFDAKCESLEDKHYILKELKEGRSFKKQWDQLKELHEMGAVAGLLIWFKEKGKITWVPVPVIAGIIAQGESGLRGVTFDTLGTFSQDDCDPINLRELTKGVRKCKCRTNAITP